MRLIDLDELLKFPIRLDTYDKKNGNKHFVFGIESVLEYAENLPIVDAVEVVRCKDCESWQTDWKPKGCEHEDAHFCEMIGRVVCADHYCGYAERKEE